MYAMSVNGITCVALSVLAFQ